MSHIFVVLHGAARSCIKLNKTSSYNDIDMFSLSHGTAQYCTTFHVKQAPEHAPEFSLCAVSHESNRSHFAWRCIIFSAISPLFEAGEWR